MELHSEIQKLKDVLVYQIDCILFKAKIQEYHVNAIVEYVMLLHAFLPKAENCTQKGVLSK